MTHTLTLAYSRSGEQIAETVTITSEGELGLDVVVPGSTSDVQVLATIDVSQLSLVFITTDQTVTIETNSSSSPAESIVITADKPYIWYTGCGWVNRFATDVTALYLTRGSAGDATVNMRFAYDATP